ncbi:cyclase family protein [Rhodococcus rhodochrous]|uniref:Cyclase family protein n=1 Tax=Rhodococcus rhodochrous TaxID=1829 RepID=A0AAW4XPH5_RHORH|nr:cyclase family protein [Rhodococcus rhodochrous]MCD2114585.1 cyclase family protein [Rhodococcus rhodochrous]
MIGADRPEVHLHHEEGQPVLSTTPQQRAYDDVPAYKDLPLQGSHPTSWEVFGSDDDRGTTNFLTPERILAATKSIREGRVISLDYPVNAFMPFPTGTREGASHTLFANNRYHRDDYLDSFYLQSTSQIDALKHIGHPEVGFYGGIDPDRLAEDESRLGIDAFARGLAGRGVLLDLERYLSGQGRPLDQESPTKIHLRDLLGAAEHQGVEIRRGDILLLRFGWASHYLALGPEERAARNKLNHYPGLAQTTEIVTWLWDMQIAMIAADNLGVECSSLDGSHFALPNQPPPQRGPEHNGMLHRVLIPLLGMPLGELWALDELAEHCSNTGRWDFFLVSKPLNIRGGAGSPANAVAIV